MKIPFRGDLRQLSRVEVELGHSSNVLGVGYWSRPTPTRTVAAE